LLFLLFNLPEVLIEGRTRVEPAPDKDQERLL
jgi:hypothetical protein